MKGSAGRSRWERRAKENDNGSVRAGSNDQSGKGSLGRKENDNGSLRANSNEQKRRQGSLGGKKMDIEALTTWNGIGPSSKTNEKRGDEMWM